MSGDRAPRHGEKWNTLECVYAVSQCREGRVASGVAKELGRPVIGTIQKTANLVSEQALRHWPRKRPPKVSDLLNLMTYERTPDRKWGICSLLIRRIDEEIACQQSTALNSATPSQP